MIPASRQRSAEVGPEADAVSAYVLRMPLEPVPQLRLRPLREPGADQARRALEDRQLAEWIGRDGEHQPRGERRGHDQLDEQPVHQTSLAAEPHVDRPQPPGDRGVIGSEQAHREHEVPRRRGREQDGRDPRREQRRDVARDPAGPSRLGIPTAGRAHRFGGSIPFVVRGPRSRRTPGAATRRGARSCTPGPDANRDGPRGPLPSARRACLLSVTPA